ncbi:hypothetical protein PRIPAC_96372 [Pristionchus pacificus]|uniref:Uncharacterized protein n=1 Tax=Pristionchus pacificus TaxID=54126 RepID=A0A2A6BCZ2_PRIPA|nr:hypothetical protein PRIPAC_96372 [Pristionchus pacificus]|eukprot:PDM63701.1 hypothetical protein PRIPAC_49674 [Pristionchus pacificus]
MKVVRDDMKALRESGMTYREIAREMRKRRDNLHHTTVRRILLRRGLKKPRKPYSPRSVPRFLHPTVKALVDELYAVENTRTTKQIIDLVKERMGIDIKKDVVACIREELGLRQFRVRYGHAVRVVNQLIRLIYCEKMLEKGEQFLVHTFTDESYVQLGKNARTCFVKNRADAVKAAPKHVPKLLIWAGISVRGPTPITILRGKDCIVNSLKYQSILHESFLERNRMTFGPIGKLVQDAAPCHSSKSTKYYLERSEISRAQFLKEALVDLCMPIKTLLANPNLTLAEYSAIANKEKARLEKKQERQELAGASNELDATSAKKRRFIDRGAGRDDGEEEEEERHGERRTNDGSPEHSEASDDDEEEEEEEEVGDAEDDEMEDGREGDEEVDEGVDGIADGRMTRRMTRASSTAMNSAQNLIDGVQDRRGVKRGQRGDKKLLSVEPVERSRKKDNKGEATKDSENKLNEQRFEERRKRMAEEKKMEKLCRNPIAAVDGLLEAVQSAKAAEQNNVKEAEDKIIELTASLVQMRLNVAKFEKEETRLAELKVNVEKEEGLSNEFFEKFQAHKLTAAQLIRTELQRAAAQERIENLTEHRSDPAGNEDQKNPIAINSSKKGKEKSNDKKKEDCKPSGGDSMEQKEDKNEENSGKKGEDDESQGGQLSMAANGKKPEELEENGKDRTSGGLDLMNENGVKPGDVNGTPSTSTAVPAGPSTSKPVPMDVDPFHFKPDY